MSNTRLCVVSRFAQRQGKQQKYLDPTWLHKRAYIYLHFTLYSLLRQTDRDFDIAITCHPDVRPVLAPYEEMLTAKGVIVSYDHLRQYLDERRDQYSHFAELRIDSDDMYAEDAVALVKKGFETHSAVQFARGLRMRVQAERLERYRAPSPPFYARRVAQEHVRQHQDFITQVMVARGRRGSHRFFNGVFKPRILPDNRFCVMRHGVNHGGAGGSHGKKRVDIALLKPFGITIAEAHERLCSIPPVPQKDA